MKLSKIELLLSAELSAERSVFSSCTNLELAIEGKKGLCKEDDRLAFSMALANWCLAHSL
jgi:hypothetical protein